MKIFLDASVILAGLKSETGGSRVILLLSEGRKFKAITSEPVLEEVRRNIKKKFSENELLRFIEWLNNARPLIVVIDEKEVARFRKFVASKDVHVLTAATKARAKYLVTLDKKHLLKIRQNKVRFCFKIVTPGELINLL